MRGGAAEKKGCLGRRPLQENTYKLWIAQQRRCTYPANYKDRVSSCIQLLAAEVWNRSQLNKRCSVCGLSTALGITQNEAPFPYDYFQT